MPNITLSVKVAGGKRTVPSVAVWLPGNPHTIEFANGKTVSSEQLARWIEKNLTATLKEVAGYE